LGLGYIFREPLGEKVWRLGQQPDIKTPLTDWWAEVGQSIGCDT
jgi:hypothetical protein